MKNKFASNLKYLRESRKVSQQQIADNIGVDRSTIGYWESEKADPTMLNVYKVANFFDIALDVLITHDMKNEEDSIDSLDDVQILYDNIKNRLTAEDKRKIYLYLEEFKKRLDKEEA